LSLPAWQALQSQCDAGARELRLGDLFASDPDRFDRFSLQAGDLFLDYSRNLLDEAVRRSLIELADQAGVVTATEAMFAGDVINVTEGRSVLHVALRSEAGDGVGSGVPGVDEVHEVLDAMGRFIDAVHRCERLGATGRPLREIVNIGIGGSDLGPVMASRALRHHWLPGLRFHSVSNVDGSELSDLCTELDPEATLFVICSKTFTTQETMVNAAAARDWVVARLGPDAVTAHFAAASTNHEAMDRFGIDPSRRFGFWDWVGGRYSLWSAVGLSLALVIGMAKFRELLGGARLIDRHFRTAPLAENMPVLLAMIGIWYNNFLGADTQAVLPYDNRLDRFPAYLQQLHMESNGKRVQADGTEVAFDTGPVIWGEPGSNGQHSFYQLLHQGTRFVPIDFILPLAASGSPQAQHDLAIANCLAQSEALMDGQVEADSPHRRYPGNRPSNTILLPALNPSTLGQLIALYEHRVFVEGVIWGINSFDQFGVELGKKLAGGLGPVVAGAEAYAGRNPSTAGLLERIAARRRS